MTDDAFELLDIGEGRRLERFGDRVVDRPHPAATGPRRDPAAWADPDLWYGRWAGWKGEPSRVGPWAVQVDGLTLELRPTPAGQVGLFPEQLAMLPWLRETVSMRALSGPPLAQPAVLNLFAYTGLATLALVSAGAAVTHVDGSRPTVGWARRNADRSGLADRPIRWIVDDAASFVERERRRERRYDGIVLDPPTYGHGRGRKAWRLQDDVADLLARCATLTEGRRPFVLLTSHTPGIGSADLAEVVAEQFRVSRNTIEAGPLGLTARSGVHLPLGAFARFRP